MSSMMIVQLKWHVVRKLHRIFYRVRDRVIFLVLYPRKIADASREPRNGLLRHIHTVDAHTCINSRSVVRQGIFHHLEHSVRIAVTEKQYMRCYRDSF